jgi:2-dehydro-3-deoxyphosphogluconate aldolase / (4S)-4-hydroxy-2-oxoglutarate aldolase
MTFLAEFQASRVVGIVRGLALDEVSCLAQAAIGAGLRFLEITMNTEQACSKIARLRAELPDGVWVGAGTVLSCRELDDAVAAGARFIVSPVLVPEVVEAAVARELPIMPGALTPQEIWQAHRAGATLVKVFPIQVFGPGYLKELRGPFGDLPLLACGGVNADNAADYLKAGATGLAIGASTIRRSWLKEGNTVALTESISKVIRAAEVSAARER